MNRKTPEQLVSIVGGGVAGIHCARHLQSREIDFRLSEGSDGLGGRMRTDVLDGFRLDRGFQVFQSAYPEAQQALDYRALRLSALVPGALIRKGAKWVSMVDPLRRPQYALGTLFNPIGNIADRFRLLRLQWMVRHKSIDELLNVGPDKSTRELLVDDYAFSSDFITSFLRPWLSGIFLERELATSARFFQFVFKMLSSGRIYYPRAGIQAIPDQLAAPLPAASIELNCAAEAITNGRIRIAGEDRPAHKCVLAIPMGAAAQLLGQPSLDRGAVSTTCIYFVADRPPVAEPILMLNGEGEGAVNHVFVTSNASSAVAPSGKALVNVSLVGDAPYDSAQVRSQLSNWFGQQVRAWSELAVYRIPQALPQQPAGFQNALHRESVAGVVLCGDYCESASLQGALRSGRIAAELVAGRQPPP